MRRALTLLELILVVVILGILAKVAAVVFHPGYLRDDARYVALLIRQAQHQGIGYDHRRFDGGYLDDGIGCLTLDASALESNATQGKARYRLHAQLSGELAGKRVCFDHLGRPGENDYAHPFEQAKTLTLRYRDREQNLTLFPYTGCVILSH